MIIIKTNLKTNDLKKLSITKSLIKYISKHNTYLTSLEVIKILKKGMIIHTSFNKYELIKK